MRKRKDIVCMADLVYCVKFLLDKHELEFICYSKEDISEAGQVDFREIRPKKKGS